LSLLKLYSLSLLKLLHGMALYIFSLRSRRQNKAWGGARERETPGMTRDLSTSPRMRATAIDSASMMMKVRTTNNCRPLRGLGGIGCVVLLGLRAVALHPRLYSVARIRGLGFDTRISNKSFRNDKVFILRAA
jgi:hypothetical protein